MAFRDQDSDDEFGDEDTLQARTMSQMKRSRIDLSRRYVFLCPTSLSKHFEVLPPQAKEAALLVFRCNRNFLFKDPPSVRRARTQARVDCGAAVKPKGYTTSGNKASLAGLYRSEFSEEFLQWVLQKETENCVFWYKPDKDLRALSKFFEAKTDPLDDEPYRPLLLDAMWWRIRFDRTSARYVGNPRLILRAIAESHGSHGHHTSSGLDDRDIDLPSLQELIFQSNPSLECVVKWPHAPSMRFLPSKLSELEYKGYIEGSSGKVPIPENAFERISRWPEKPRGGRLDDLHYHWQTTETSCLRRGVLALHGKSSLGGAMTAR